MTELQRNDLSVDRERAILVGVILPDSTADPRDPLGELESLLKTAGGVAVGRVLQRKMRPEASSYIGSGKALEVAALAKKTEANAVIFDNDLSPSQIGTLEKIINKELKSPLGRGVKVIDRSELILDIFATRAQTYEAKLQVELAQMEYTYPRLARMWGHLERLAGGGGSLGIGTRGPGETQLEIDRRLVRKRVSDLKGELEKVQARKTRLVQARNADHYTVCIVGYTNAGKSTLFNTLTSAGTYADDKLFATLDTKTRAWKVDRGVDVLLSDTVGFVRDLPHNLVASFKATLEEAVHADLLIHVLDVGHPHAQQQYAAVHQVLEEIGVKPSTGSGQEGKPELLLLNKIDTAEGEAAMPFWRAMHGDALAVSARAGLGLDAVAERVREFVRGQQVEVTLSCDSTDGKLIGWIEANMRILDRRFSEDAARVEFDVIVGKQTLKALQQNEALEVRERSRAEALLGRDA